MKVDYDLYYKDSGSVNKGHYVESNESVSISLSHDYTTLKIISMLLMWREVPRTFVKDHCVAIKFKKENNRTIIKKINSASF